MPGLDAYQSPITATRPVLIWIKARARQSVHQKTMWQPISTAPFDHELELAVIDENGPHALIFPCHRIFCGWINAKTKRRVKVHPTHWREWNGGQPFDPGQCAPR